MAGTPAGRLNIEIVAEIARLQQDLDKAKRAVKAASADIAQNAKHANDNLAGFGRGITGAGNNSKLATHHLSNLSFQLQDIFIGLQGGQKPMTVFLQQGSQIGQIMMQAGVGVGGLAKEVAGMAGRFALAHPILLAVSAAGGLVAGAMALVTTEINKTSEVTVTWQDVMLGAFDLVKDAVSNEVTAAFDAMGVDIGKVWDWIVETTKTAVNLIIGMSTMVPRVIAATYDKIGPAIGDAFYSGANLAISALNMLAQMSAEPLNLIIGGLNQAFGTDIPRIVVSGIKGIENPYAGAMGALGAAGVAAFTDTFKRDYIGDLASALSEAAQARARSRKAAEDAGKELGRAAGKAAGKEAAKEMMMSFAEAFKDVADYMKRIEAETAETQRLNKSNEALRREFEVLGMTGEAREARLKQLEYEATLGPYLIKLNEALSSGEEQRAVEIQKQIDLLKERFVLEGKISDYASEADKAAEAQRRLNDSLYDMVSLLDRIGGAGSVLGSILAIASGNFNGVASGPVGDLLAYVLNTPTGNTITKDGREIAELIGNRLESVFSKGGAFDQTLGQNLQSAGLGYAAANAAGMSGAGSGAGSSLGGVLGQAVGSKIFGFLGSAAGPVGAIVGGLLGGLVGSLFGGTKKGVIGIGGSGENLSVYGTKHSNSERVAAATQAADGIISSMQQLAGALGGTVNAARASVTLGIRKDNFVVDPTGRGRTEGAGVLNFGKDQAAATKAVISDMIKDGVIGGVRAGTMRLLQGNDLEEGLRKALAFEAVFKELESSSNPFVAQLKEMQAGFDDLTMIFQQAGASAAEYAQLQDFIAKKTQALIDSASASYRNTFYTDAQNVAYAKSQISTQLTPLGLGNVQTVAQYTRLVEATDALANPELYGALMDLADEFGVLKDAADQAAAATKANAAAKKAEKEAALNDAKSAVRQAYDRESSALQQTIDAAEKAAETLKDFRDSLNGVGGGAANVNALLAKVMSVGSLAGAGDLTAASQLPGVGKEYLDAARQSAGSFTDYQRAVATVARYTDQAILAAVDTKTDAQMQLDVMTQQVSKLVDINDSVISLEEAVNRLFILMEKTDRRWERMTRDGVSLVVSTDEDNPLATA